MTSSALPGFSPVPSWFTPADPALAKAFAPCADHFQRYFSAERFGDLPRWLEALQALPHITPSQIRLDNPAITIGHSGDCDDNTRQQLHSALKQLHPWRKGPFDFFGVHIDTEWRSDWKWDRVKDAIEPLTGKTVLDVGCGSGYHCWRMRGAGAAHVIGIEPTPLFIVQFQAAQKYIRDEAVTLLPLRLEEMPDSLALFDTVFSMGVLYHRRDPLDHLRELKAALKPGGQLVLETLVIDGAEGDCLRPEGRYSKMGNVWAIPSPATLARWLAECHFTDIRCIDVSRTTLDEQRSTEWMTFQSLRDFLDPANPDRTVEGYPAPRRAILLARR